MTAKILIDECVQSGVVVLLDAGKLKLRGAPDAVKAAADRLRPYKTELLAYLATQPETDIWGPYTPYCCPVSPALVDELHALIAQFAALYRLADDATARIINEAKRQPASTVAASVAWFQQKIDSATGATE